MTCRHALDLIDAGPFADPRPAHMDAARAHARQCATCGPALQASERLSAGLSELAQPAPPIELGALVMARLEDADPAREVAVAPDRMVRSGLRDWSAWATVVGGVSAGAAIVLSVSSGDGATLAALSPVARWMPADVLALASPAPGTAVLGAGLVLYVAGLLLPLADRRRR